MEPRKSQRLQDRATHASAVSAALVPAVVAPAAPAAIAPIVPAVGNAPAPVIVAAAPAAPPGPPDPLPVPPVLTVHFGNVPAVIYPFTLNYPPNRHGRTAPPTEQAMHLRRVLKNHYRYHRGNPPMLLTGQRMVHQAWANKSNDTDSLIFNNTGGAGSTRSALERAVGRTCDLAIDRLIAEGKVDPNFVDTNP